MVGKALTLLSKIHKCITPKGSWSSYRLVCNHIGTLHTTLQRLYISIVEGRCGEKIHISYISEGIYLFCTACWMSQLHDSYYTVEVDSALFHCAAIVGLLANNHEKQINLCVSWFLFLRAIIVRNHSLTILKGSSALSLLIFRFRN